MVVLAHGVTPEQLRPWLRQFVGDHRHVITAAGDPQGPAMAGHIERHEAETGDQIAEQIKQLGPVDLLVSLLPPGQLPRDIADNYDLWRRLFFHIKPNGLYVLDLRYARGAELGDALAAWVRTLADPDGAEPVPKRAGQGSKRLTSTKAVMVSRKLMIVQKRGKHYVKLRDAETNRVLPAREPRISVRELGMLPSGDITSAAVITTHESSAPIGRMPMALPYPALHLRHYRGRIAFAGNLLMYGDYTILPDSFRYHLKAGMSNKLIKDVAGFAKIPAALQPKETLAGNYYQLDSHSPGHFGHFMTEVLSRLWGWDQAKEIIPDLKVIFKRRERDVEPQLERRYLETYGIAPDDIVWTDHPVFLESVVAATPMWHNAVPFYVHPGIRDTWDRLGCKLIDRSASTPDRIFVSRGDRWSARHCHNKTDVERFFEANNFTIVYPEDLDLSQQATIFAGATVIAGFGGSAMFNMMYAKRMKALILLSHEAYTARNEHLFTSLLGGDVHYFWSVPDIPHPPGRWSREAFFSGWEFDFERNRRRLQILIDSL